MTEPSSRVACQISTAELERRWAAIRASMIEAEIDALVMQTNNDLLGGYPKYFTDISAYVMPTAVVFPIDAPMTLVMHGAPGERRLPSEGDGILRGVSRVLTTNAFPSAAYTHRYDLEHVVGALEGFERARIGLLGPTQMSYAMGRGLQEELPQADFVDASELIDRIKAIKSPEEQELIKACALLQDEVMAEVAAAIQPGLRDHDVLAIARAACERRGSENGVYLCSSAPQGESATLAPSHFGNRVIRRGDVVVLLIECNHPSGMYVELGRTFVLGSPPDDLQEEHDFALEAQRFTCGLLRPGAAPADVWAAYNEFMLEHDRPEEQRLHSHGQGYDLVERPLIRRDETMEIASGMNFTAHPMFVRRNLLAWTCDNWLIGPDGPGQRLHGYPQDLIVVD